VWVEPVCSFARRWSLHSSHPVPHLRAEKDRLGCVVARTRLRRSSRLLGCATFQQKFAWRLRRHFGRTPLSCCDEPEQPADEPQTQTLDRRFLLHPAAGRLGNSFEHCTHPKQRQTTQPTTHRQVNKTISEKLQTAAPHLFLTLAVFKSFPTQN